MMWEMSMMSESIDDEKMKKHCKMMPQMKWCEKYASWEGKYTCDWGKWCKMWEKETMGEMMWMMGWDTWETFDESTAWLPEAKKSEIVELKDGDTYEMVASAVKQEVGNRTIKRLAYNGMIPGPILKVEKGANIKLKFTNNLEIETTLHSHGLRLDDSKFDGLPTTMGGQQKPMKPGEKFTYELNFPDTGVYWYHPHMREDYTQEMGLYGNYHVTEEGYWNEVDREEFLILDDFSEDNVFYKNKINKTLMGRFGDIMMINNDENYTLTAKTGEKIRFFITNVANTRTFDFWIFKGKKAQGVKLVGWDIGRIEKEVIISNQIIAPAERYIIELWFDLSWEYLIKSKDRVLWRIVVSWEDIVSENTIDNIEINTLRNNSADYKDIRDNLQTYLDKPADKELRLTISMKGMWEMRMWMDHKDGMGNMMWGNDEDMMKKEASLGGKWEHSEDDGIEWEDDMKMMNNMSNDQMMEWIMVDEQTKKENMDIKWNFKKGDMVKVKIFNDPESMHPMQHPVHFHGQKFVVLSRDGEPNDNLQWKDTTLVRNGETIEILVEMTNPWIWMSHCHIAEHLQSGMMMVFKVEE